MQSLLFSKWKTVISNFFFFPRVKPWLLWNLPKKHAKLLPYQHCLHIHGALQHLQGNSSHIYNFNPVVPKTSNHGYFLSNFLESSQEVLCLYLSLFFFFQRLRISVYWIFCYFKLVVNIYLACKNTSFEFLFCKKSLFVIENIFCITCGSNHSFSDDFSY